MSGFKWTTFILEICKCKWPQGSIPQPLQFLVYIDDLSNGVKFNPKLFAGDTTLFSVIHRVNKDSDKINIWAYQ